MDKHSEAIETNEIDAHRWTHLVQEMVKKTEYGVIQLVIHDSRVVRLERTEKVLLEEQNVSRGKKR